MTSGSFGKNLKLHLFSRVARITFLTAPEHNIEGTKQTRMKKILISTFKLIFAQPQVTHMEIGINHTMQIFIVYSFITGLFSCKLRQTRKSSTHSSLRQRQKIVSRGDLFLLFYNETGHCVVKHVSCMIAQGDCVKLPQIYYYGCYTV